MQQAFLMLLSQGGSSHPFEHDAKLYIEASTEIDVDRLLGFFVAQSMRFIFLRICPELFRRTILIDARELELAILLAIDFDMASNHIDEPVFLDACFCIRAHLRRAVTHRRARRKHLDDERRRADNAIQLNLFRIANDHRVRNETIFFIEKNINAVWKSLTLLSLQCFIKNTIDSPSGPRVIHARVRRHHDNLPVNELRADFIIRCLRCLSHTMTSLRQNIEFF